MHIGNIIYIYIALFTGFYTSQVVQDFFHQEYENQHLPLPPKQRNHLIWVNIKCFNYYLSQKSNAKYLDARWKLESFTLMALSSSKSSSNRLWRNVSACWYKRRSRVSWLFFCGFDWWKANHKQQMLEGAILPSLFFWKMDWEFFVLYIYQKKTSGIQKLQRTIPITGITSVTQGQTNPDPQDSPAAGHASLNGRSQVIWLSKKRS